MKQPCQPTNVCVSFAANDDHIVQSNTLEGRRWHGSYPQNQLRRAHIASSIGDTVNRRSSSAATTNTASNNRRPTSGFTRPQSPSSKRALLSTMGREPMAGKLNAALYQKSNSGTTLRQHPKVQDKLPAVNRQTWSVLQNAYKAGKRTSSSPSLLWNQQRNGQQSPLVNRPSPAKSLALYGQRAAPQSGLSPRGSTSATARGRKVSRTRDQTGQSSTNRYGASSRLTSTHYKLDTRRRGATQPRVAKIAERFHDPKLDDPRYEPVVVYRIPEEYGGSFIIRARNEQTDAAPQRREPPNRQWQSQSVWAQRKNSR